MEEYGFHTLPVGGWNTLGAFSAKSTAMGETFFSSLNSSSGYLNPSFLAVLGKPVLSFNYRFNKNTYKTSFQSPIVPLLFPIYPGTETYSFSRKTDSIDYFGLALPFKNWVVAANYFLFQDYRIPEISSPAMGWYNWLNRLKQSGDMKAVNLAVAYRASSSFTVGISASYLFGDISRFQSYQPIWYIMDKYCRESTAPNPPEFVPWLWPSISEDYEIDLDGLFFDLGVTYQRSDRWAVGFALRPPFSMNLEVGVDITYEDLSVPDAPVRTMEHTSGKYYSKQPLIATASGFYRPTESMMLTLDLSYWAWSGASTDYHPNWYYPQEFKDILKLNLGAEYLVSLPFEEINDLALRAGYIYDPQPYRYAEGTARNFLCAGCGIDIGPFEIEFSAKISVAAKELRRFNSNQIQMGITYHSR